jgi:hypothetical protein
VILRVPRLRTGLAIVLVAVGILLPTTAAGAATKGTGSPLGLPPHSSLLFALDGTDGTIVHRPGASKDDRYTLTLRGLAGNTTWFSDRPRRDAGRLATDRFFGGWGQFGFRAVPPNAALVVSDRGHTHTMALELKLRRYDAGRHLARFDVRTLGSLGGGLRHLNAALEPHLPRSFHSPSLFIDNSRPPEAAGCTLGQTQLMAFEAPGVASMTPARGEFLPIDQNTALYSIYGTRFGGDGYDDFALPNMTSPPGTQWYVCVGGRYPTSQRLAPSCTLGETSYWILPFQYFDDGEDSSWLLADGRTLTTAQYPEYGAEYAAAAPTFALPDVTAPPGMTALTCVQSVEPPEPYVGQLDLFPGTPVDAQVDWEPASGQVTKSPALLTLLEDQGSTKIPNLAPVAPGASYFIATYGAWPLVN